MPTRLTCEPRRARQGRKEPELVLSSGFAPEPLDWMLHIMALAYPILDS